MRSAALAAGAAKGLRHRGRAHQGERAGTQVGAEGVPGGQGILPSVQGAAEEREH